MYDPHVVGRITSNQQLQQDLERYLKLTDGASRILSMAQNPRHRLDAAKTLFVSNAQLMLCLRQVQREKVTAAYRASRYGDWSPPAVVTDNHDVPATNTNQCGLARLCLSDIRIPLLWRDTPLGSNMTFLMNRLFPPNSLLQGVGDLTDKMDSNDPCDGYSVFCLVHTGNTIKDTRLVFDIKPGMTDVEFEDKLIFENVSPDFRCTIDVYACPRFTFKSAMVYSRRRAQIVDNLRKTIDQPEHSLLRGTLFQTIPSYFDLVARCTASLADVGGFARAHTLERGPQLTSPSFDANFSDLPSPDANGGEHTKKRSSTHLHTNEPTAATNQNDIPLFGNICYRLTAQPNSAHSTLHSGYMWIRKLTASPVQLPAKLYRCELKDRHLWAYAVESIIDQEECMPNGTDLVHPGGDTPATVTEDVFHTDGVPNNQPLSSDQSRADVPSPSATIQSQIVTSSHTSLKLAITPKTMFLDVKPLSRLIRVETPGVRKRKKTEAPETDEPVAAPNPLDNGTVASPRSSSQVSTSSRDLFDNLPPRCSPAELPPSQTTPERINNPSPECSRSLTNLRDLSESPFKRVNWKSMECISSCRVPSSNSIGTQVPPAGFGEVVTSEPATVCAPPPDKPVLFSPLPLEKILSKVSVSTSDENYCRRYTLGSPTTARRIGQARRRLSAFPTSRSLDIPSVMSRTPPASNSYRFSHTELDRSGDAHLSAVEQSHPQENLDPLNGATQSPPNEFCLYTFRIATDSLVTEDSTSSRRRSSWCDGLADGQRSKWGTVNRAAVGALYELAVCTPLSVVQLVCKTSMASHELSLDADEEEAAIWLDFLHKHVEEQKTWGWTTFSQNPVLS